MKRQHEQISSSSSSRFSFGTKRRRCQRDRDYPIVKTPEPLVVLDMKCSYSTLLLHISEIITMVMTQNKTTKSNNDKGKRQLQESSDTSFRRRHDSDRAYTSSDHDESNSSIHCSYYSPYFPKELIHAIANYCVVERVQHHDVQVVGVSSLSEDLIGYDLTSILIHHGQVPPPPKPKSSSIRYALLRQQRQGQHLQNQLQQQEDGREEGEEDEGVQQRGPVFLQLTHQRRRRQELARQRRELAQEEEEAEEGQEGEREEDHGEQQQPRIVRLVIRRRIDRQPGLPRQPLPPAAPVAAAAAQHQQQQGHDDPLQLPEGQQRPRSSNQPTWWMSRNGTMPHGVGRQYVECCLTPPQSSSLYSLVRLSSVSVSIPPLPLGPKSVRTFQILYKTEDAMTTLENDHNNCAPSSNWKVGSPVFTVVNRSGYQKFDINPPIDAKYVRIVCLSNQASRFIAMQNPTNTATAVQAPNPDVNNDDDQDDDDDNNDADGDVRRRVRRRRVVILNNGGGGGPNGRAPQHQRGQPGGGGGADGEADLAGGIGGLAAAIHPIARRLQGVGFYGLIFE